VATLRYGPIRPDKSWLSVLALGAPLSLGFVGISLGSAAVIINLKLWHVGDQVATIAAYGIITRILTFAYLPLMGVNVAFQTIAGNNFGAGLAERTNQSLKIALACAFLYCLGVELVVLGLAPVLATFFVDDQAVIAETARILPINIIAYAMFGPMMIMSGYFQSLGDASKAAMLGLSRSYLFTIPLTFILPNVFGEQGIWLSAPIAEIGMLGLAMLVLTLNGRQRGWRFGLFQRPV